MDEDSVVKDRDWVLALERDLAFGEFMGEGGFVDGFEESGAESCVDFVGGVNDLAGEGIQGHV